MIRRFEDKFQKYALSHILSEKIRDVATTERTVTMLQDSGFDSDKVNALDRYISAHNSLIETILSEYDVQRGSDDFNWVFEENYALRLMGQLDAGYFFLMSDFAKNKYFEALDNVEDLGNHPVVLEIIPEEEMLPVVEMYEAAVKQKLIIPNYKVTFHTEKIGHYSEDPTRAILLIN